MTRIVVTGAGGQVGAELARSTAWADDDQVTTLTRAALDITDDQAVTATLDRLRPDVVVNAAAYTAVDAAEDDEETARSVNATAVGHLADWAEAAGARLIHVSTDYVFDGTKDDWYVETDAIAPIGAYGRTKAAGEAAARRATDHVILRTAWVYGALGNNFVATMLRLGHERDELAVVADQTGCPTSAADIANAIIRLVDEAPDVRGTYHLASPTPVTWHEFATAILADRIDAGLVVRPITTAEYPTPAARPANSRLDSSALRGVSGIGVRNWQDALGEVVAELLTSNEEES